MNASLLLHVYIHKCSSYAPNTGGYLSASITFGLPVAEGYFPIMCTLSTWHNACLIPQRKLQQKWSIRQSIIMEIRKLSIVDWRILKCGRCYSSLS